MIRASGSNHEHDQRAGSVSSSDTPLPRCAIKDLVSPVFIEDSLVLERGRPNQAERTSAILTEGWITHVVHSGRPLICPLG
ncbi:MAG: hypothetical protein QOE54_4698 [Streptosporangiaceae bacterium]|nr:hypothetical protein [Streptosporangiaceae bacterium]